MVFVGRRGVHSPDNEQGEDHMAVLIDNIQWVMLAAGLLTCSMIQATVAPRTTIRTYFGEAPDSPQFDLVVRNWGMLITAAGALLVWASFVPDVRLAAIALAIVTKTAFIALMLGSGVMKQQAWVALVVDTIMITLLAVYLIATMGQAA
jgi:hypothetical protein